MQKADCVFCKIANGEAPAHVVWENKSHIAFLTIFPNTVGVTVVAPREHYPSYIFENEDQIVTEQMIASKKVAQVLDNYFDDVGRTGVVFEGFGVDHLHTKLYPLHGTGNMIAWKNIESEKKREFYPQYPGFICSNDSERANDEDLAKLAAAIKDSSKI